MTYGYVTKRPLRSRSRISVAEVKASILTIFGTIIPSFAVNIVVSAAKGTVVAGKQEDGCTRHVQAVLGQQVLKP